ncbi:LysR family substrate-binding domain-containing protein, partial [Roseisolibacter sp. H3M3-2]|uniref:LysR family substrate-binding domain-containing protein n=1 Tax=Roseisolibacter sp. H3M3-2 TaxID=3031323 RepID=UPI0023D991E7
LLEHARRTLAAAADGAVAVRAVAEGLTGSLRVGTVDYGDHPPRIAAALDAFRAGHPRVDVTVDHTPWTRQQAAVRDAELDVGLCPATDAERLLDGLEAEALHVESVSHAALAAAHPLAGRGEIALADLRDVPILLPERAVYPAMYDEIIDEHRRAGVEPRVISSALSPMATIFQQVATGAGYVLLFEGMARAALPGVRAVRVRDCGIVVRLYALRRAADRRPLVSAFVQRLRDAYGEGAAPA